MTRRLGYNFLALRRLSYGYSPEALDEFSKMGKTPKARYANFLDEQLSPEKITDDDCEKKVKAQGFTCIEKTIDVAWQDHRQKPNELKEQLEKKSTDMTTDNAFGMAQADIRKLRLQPVIEVEKAAWLRAVYSRKQLFEKMVHFWHDHFSVFAQDDNIAPGFAVFDREVVRKYALGNFRELLGAVAQSPAMIFYLDNFVNQSGNANENYARELLELHTLGAENYMGTMDRSKVTGYSKKVSRGYVDGDVYEAARCFTGWRVNTGKDTKENGEFLYFEPWHDRFQKIFLGKSIAEYQSPMKDGNDILDILCAHPGTATFIARKLCVRFYGDHPPQGLIARAANVFRQNSKSPNQIAMTLRTILNAKEFIRTGERKFLRPFEYTVGMLRGLSAELTPSEQFINATAKTGHRLFAWRTPDGYPDISSKWDTTGSVLETWRLCHQILLGKVEGVKVTLPSVEAMGKPSDYVLKWFEKVAFLEPSPNELAAISSFLSPSLTSGNSKRAKKHEINIAAALAIVLMTPSVRWS